jgi:hypothetical protein
MGGVGVSPAPYSDAPDGLCLSPLFQGRRLRGLRRTFKVLVECQESTAYERQSRRTLFVAITGVVPKGGVQGCRVRLTCGHVVALVHLGLCVTHAPRRA